jgi:GDP-4-dehydro-6-deoxy-D-mannose reductase
MTRSFNHIGPGQSDRFVVADFARQAIEIRNGRREPVVRTGDIDVTRDFTDVRDVARAYLLLLDQGRSGEIYNVCSESERSVRDLLSAAGARRGRSPHRAGCRKIAWSEQKRMCGSNRKLHRDTGWSPKLL